jgi:hypothetical protein
MSEARFRERVLAALAEKNGTAPTFKEPAKVPRKEKAVVQAEPVDEQITVVKKERKPRKRKTGTRQEVWDGVCEKTPGGLTKADLVQRPGSSAIMSKKKHELGKQYAANMRKTNA